MGQTREEDAISTAIIETEKEIAGFAWDIEETEALDASGDRSAESLGDGLEGQHEAEDDEETEVEETEESEETEAEGEADGTGKGEPKPEAEEEPEQIPRDTPAGRVPSGKLREANERARQAEERARQIEAQRAEDARKLDALQTQIATLTQVVGQRAPTAPVVEPKVEPKAAPDIFENPTGFVDHLQQTFQSELAKRDQALQQIRVENSFAVAHAVHKDAFEEAMGAINKLNPENPDDRAIVQRIYASPNPGQAVVSWHKRNKTLQEVGDDPNAFKERIAKETRESLKNDPDFRKQLLAELRGEALNGGNDGQPRTTNRLPRSLARAGSNVGAARSDPRDSDDSDQAVADSAWR